MIYTFTRIFSNLLRMNRNMLFIVGKKKERNIWKNTKKTTKGAKNIYALKIFFRLIRKKWNKLFLQYISNSLIYTVISLNHKQSWTLYFFIEFRCAFIGKITNYYRARDKCVNKINVDFEKILVESLFNSELFQSETLYVTETRIIVGITTLFYTYITISC